MHLFLFCTLFIAYSISTSYAHSITLEKGDMVPLEGSNDKEGLERLLTRTKRSNGRWTAQQVIECIFAIFLPPVAILIHGGHEWVLHFIINIVLTIIGWLPGNKYIFYICNFPYGKLYYDSI
ncbi:hypothetical protein Mgra_00000323 [Meloidogyne graminicola]|uniref:Uncharacterized protein n=1 Tax=Meloidogyne graminicola TaxID=189291 RepID=A0A8T0A4N1_9BILA|nr:hypothetical protein Mgra_00000323 [Meloidogyne graminicola]